MKKGITKDVPLQEFFFYKCESEHHNSLLYMRIWGSFKSAKKNHKSQFRKSRKKIESANRKSSNCQVSGMSANQANFKSPQVCKFLGVDTYILEVEVSSAVVMIDQNTHGSRLKGPQAGD